jgi:pimeloyl-ACP methyl ester carboxylesterase
LAEVDRPPVGAVEFKLPEEINDCVAYVPETYHPAVPHGVIVWLTEPGTSTVTSWIEQYQQLCSQYDLIVLAPQPADPERWQPTEIDFIRKSLDDLISKYNIDRTRIVVQGNQAGGAMAWLTALAHRDLIRAVIPFDSPLPARVQCPANDPIERLAIHIAFPKNSQLAKRIRTEAQQLEALKYPVRIEELEDDAKQLGETQSPTQPAGSTPSTACKHPAKSFLSIKVALQVRATGSGVVFGQRSTTWQAACPKTTPDPFRRFHQEIPGRVPKDRQPGGIVGVHDLSCSRCRSEATKWKLRDNTLKHELQRGRGRESFSGRPASKWRIVARKRLPTPSAKPGERHGASRRCCPETGG